MKKRISFIDSEVSVTKKEVQEIGVIRYDGNQHRGVRSLLFEDFLKGTEFLCGHNVFRHDLKYIPASIWSPYKIIDTLFLSPLLFPKRPYHALVKDEKLITDELNNPITDCHKAAALFYDEVAAFNILDNRYKEIYYLLLGKIKEFACFFDYVDFSCTSKPVVDLIRDVFDGEICEHSKLEEIVEKYPIALAYAVSLLACRDHQSITPPWVAKSFPEVEDIIHELRGISCNDCSYCVEHLNVKRGLKLFFGYDEFRSYNGEPLQEQAASSAINGESLLAVFPTGGGKSITFQLPALMAGEAEHGLTVVISPLQSLMKDQVDNLNQKGISEATTINGSQDPLERKQELERLESGAATLLYISPEQLRSRTIERILQNRNIVRFVIDEAHCFSAWGQDFRVDYLFIGKFIRELQKQKQIKKQIPVSCFTATAKQKVISDICEYFKQELDIELKLFASSATRENLHYRVLHCDTDEAKYLTLRELIKTKNCPTIVYASRTARTHKLAEQLSKDGINARPYNGKMDVSDKVENQELFANNEIQVIVATSAFGMGVDKKDVGLVAHYDISDSLENYVQEAGRAGRDPALKADCYVLYSDDDLNKHFILLNQTKLSISEIQQVWTAIKKLTRSHPTIQCSALEIAREAGWDEGTQEIESRVRAAISALERAGYVERGKNCPRVYATSIRVHSMIEAVNKIDNSPFFSEEYRDTAKRIIKSLITAKVSNSAQNDVAESRIDYLADILGLTKEVVVNSITLMRQEGILSDTQDMSAQLLGSDTENKARLELEKFSKLEEFFFKYLGESANEFNLKEINEKAFAEGISSSSVKNLRTIIYFWQIRNYVTKRETTNAVSVSPNIDLKKLQHRFDQRIDICHFVIRELYKLSKNIVADKSGSKTIQFSFIDLFQSYKAQILPGSFNNDLTCHDFEEALLYLSKIRSINIVGGFLVLYNAIEVHRIVKDNKLRYKQEDYRYFDEFYKHRIQQIHIVGEYANLMVSNYQAALDFVRDYFQMDFKKFIAKYFKGQRAKDIQRNITPAQYEKLFGGLSKIQEEIITDDTSQHIVVAAGPGSGKTRVLVHKLAALLTLEDIKHEQLLMLTFSRAAATEFKQRLKELIGNAANYVEIKTFHSYCFDLLGRIGTIELSDQVVRQATDFIKKGEIEQGRITKRVLVIDEAQDMDESAFELVKALMYQNSDMRVIAVGDDDQNIYNFRGSDSLFFQSLIIHDNAKCYELVDNYRSTKEIVALANEFVKPLHNRLKTTPINSVSTDSGEIRIIEHTSRYMQEALLKNIAKETAGRKIAVLTNTNDEALQIFCLLKKNKFKAQLVQSLDSSVKLSNLAELRYFMKLAWEDRTSPTIASELWNKARQKLREKYAKSECLDLCENILSTFEQVNDTGRSGVDGSRQFNKYKSDFIEFVRESNSDDFIDQNQRIIYVSTIHKSKGKEYDSVYMLLDNYKLNTDEERRCIYVGMTRAKSRLVIHVNTNLFSGINLPNINYEFNPIDYGEPSELALQLGYRDVNLGFFIDKKKQILLLRSGDELKPVVNKFGNIQLELPDGRPICILSKACRERLLLLFENGYELSNAKIDYIAAWKSEEVGEETAIILPSIYLKKR